MSNSNFLLLKSAENKVEAIRQFVQTTCIFQFMDVTGRELDLLCELLRCGGVNDKAKTSFMINYKTTKENYGQLIKRLSDKGILIDNERRNGKRLHQTLLSLLDLYINSKNPHTLLVKWQPS